MTQLPHVLKRVRLNLARSKDFPAGSARHGYEFVAPLDAEGRIDAEQWRKYREHCGVRRFWDNDEEVGRLVHKPGGTEHARWVFDYDEAAEEDDEAGYRFWDNDEEVGRLVHKPGGAEHARWVFDYDEAAEEDDEAGYRFGDHRFRPGEYVSVRDEDGEMHTFQVATVESAT